MRPGHPSVASGQTGATGRNRVLRAALGVVALVVAAIVAPGAASVTVFGPRTLVRDAGAPDVYEFTFDAFNPSLPYTLRLDSDGLASAIVTLNGTEVVVPRDFNPGVTVLERSVLLQRSNQLRIELRSKPDSTLTVRILGTDNKPPTITASAQPPANAAGWNRTDVQVTFTCADAESGLASCASPRIVTTEGRGQVVAGTAVDNAGNTASASVTLNIDKTPPAIAASVQPAPNADGWLNQAATVLFACTDGLSGVGTCSPPVALQIDGANQMVRGSAVDVAGNSAATSVSVNVDRTPPTITATVSPQPNVAGWNNTDVIVTFNCADATSGVAACPSPVTVSSDGANQVIRGTARDRAGNTATVSVALNVDKSGPSITASIDPPPNAAGWNRTDVTVTFTCSDALSAVASCQPPMTVSSEGAALVVTGAATDRAGNATTTSVTLKIDKTPPIVTITAPTGGAPTSPVTFGGTVTDALSGVASATCNGRAVTPAPGASITCAAIEGQNTLGAADVAGNTSTAQASVTLNHAPAVSAGGPYSGTTRAPVAFAASATDPDGDPVSFVWDFGDATPPASGATPTHLYTSQGTYTARVTASDGRGASVVATAPVSIAFVNGPPAFTSTPITSARHQMPYSYQATATDPDGDAVTFSLAQAPVGMTVNSQSGLVEWTPSGAQVGPQSVTVKVTDVFQATATQSFDVVVVDITPPVVTLQLQTEALPGSVVTATADAVDNVGVVLVTFEVNGANPSDRPNAPYQRAIDVPSDAVAGTQFHVRATARDAAGNTGTADGTFKVAAVPDTQPPTIVLNAPPQAAPGTTIRVTASAKDNVGVKTITFKADGTVLPNDPDHREETTYAIPQNAAVGSSIQFTARAVDFSDNLADAAASTLIVAAPDTTPPQVALTAPATVPEGGTLLLSATANDNVGVAGVEFFVNGVTIGTSAVEPYSASLKLPAATVGGDVLHVEARAFDAAGNEATSRGDTNVLAAPNRPPAANAGGPYTGEVGSLVALTAAASSDPDPTDQLSYDWDFGDSSTGSGISPGHAYAAEGVYTASLTVSDGRGGVGTATAAVTVVAATDRTPPSVTLFGPATALPGAQVTMTARAIDDRGVAAVTFEVDGANPTETSTEPYQRIVAIPAIASPGDRVSVRATARDFAGNRGAADASITITAVPDTEPPTVAINAPPQAAAGTTIRVSATVHDNVGVQSVSISVNGGEPKLFAAPPYETDYAIAADASAGSVLGIVAAGTDYAGNRAEQTGAVTVVAASDGDTTPPTVKLTAPLEVFAGRKLSLAADAHDNVGVASVAFFVDGVNVATLTSPPYAVDVDLAPAQVPGTLIRLRALATDFANLQGADSAQTLVVSTASAGQGVVAGEVYDDFTSLPLSDATVALTGKDATGADYAATTTTDARGRWVLRATEGQGIVRIAKPGWTTIDRSAPIQVNQALELFDGRSTRLNADAMSVSAVLGGSVTNGANALSLPPGALATATTLALTLVSQQGLQGLLPPGWSPVAAADITPHDVSFASPATLSLANTFKVAAGRPIVAAQWDDVAGAWRAVASLKVPPGGGALEAQVSSSGQYAFLLADEAPAVPATPASGDLVDGISLSPLANSAATAVDPQPRVLFYAPGVRSDVHGVITTDAPASSGLPIESRLSESYRFLAGGELHPEPFVEDLFFYQVGGPPTGVGGTFGVAPSQLFEPVSLQLGVITVELFAPPLGQRSVTTVGSDGGAASSNSGETLQVPQGALAEPLPISVRGLASDNIGVSLPPGFDLAGAALVSFSGAFGKAAVLSVTKPAGISDARQLLLVRPQELGGETRLVLVGRATIVGNQIISDTTLGGMSDAMEGVRVPGRYLFIRAAAPVGFVKGTVSAVGGGASAGALVSVDNFPIVALSAASGRYVAAAAVGAFNLTALDLQRSDSGTAGGTMPGAGGLVSLDLQIATAVPTVTSIVPADGATAVPLSNPIVVRFSRSLDSASVNGQNAGNATLSAPDGSVVSASVGLSDKNTVLTLRPSTALQASTVYAVNLGTGIADQAGRHLASPFTAHFTSFDTAPPPMPPAGSIQASIPDSGGLTTITATQGTAGVHDTVTVVNLTKKLTMPVLVEPNGSFTVKVPVSITDKLQIVITSQSGVQTVVAVARFSQTNADGSISTAVGPDGGRVTGAGGEVVDVPAGAFPNGAVVTVKMIAEAQFPVQLSDRDRQNFSFTAGIQLDLGGQLPQKYLNVGIPLRGGETEDDQWVVAQAVELAGQRRMTVVDTARVIGDRITTSSPPCPGVTGAGVYGFLRPGRPAGVLFGPLDRGLPGAVFAPFLVGPGLISLDVPDSLWGVYSAVTGTVDSLEPYLANIQTAYSALTNPSNFVCIPTLSGSVTVSANRVSLDVPAGTLTDADLEVHITNTTRGTSARVFPPFGTSINVEGSSADVFTTEAIDTRGQHRPVTLTPLPRSFVKLEVNGLLPQDTRIVVRNVTRNQTQSVPFNGGSLVPFAKLLMEGATNDVYSAQVDGAAPRSLTPTVSAYPFGSGNLVVRAIFASIDPTLAEIQAINAVVPPDRQVAEVGVRSVTLQNVTHSTETVILDLDVGVTDTTVGGAFAVAFDGSLTDVYRIIVRYNDGHADGVMIPNFHVSVTDPATGQVTRLVSGQTPPRGEPLQIDFGPPGTGPATLTFDPNAFKDVDPIAPITLAFSTALDPASVASSLAIYDSAGKKVAGSWTLSSDRRRATFAADSALRLDASYTIALSGVRDATGRLLATTTLPLTTFKPVKLSHLVLTPPPGQLPRPVKDIGFMRQPSPTGEVHTDVVAVTGNQLGNKLFTIDVTDPRTPVKVGEAAGGSFKRRVTLLHTGFNEIRYDVQLVPQQTGMSCWAAGAAMIVGWRDQISIDPSQIAAALGYWTQYQNGLPGYDKAMFAKWQLVPEPQASYDVQHFHDMLDQFGPLWVASRVPGVHVRVITGISGDGTPDGTLLYFNDPWEAGMDEFTPGNKGSEYTRTFSEFVDDEESLARVWLGVDLKPFIQELCANGSQKACDALNDPTTVAAMDRCAAGDESACNTLNWTGVHGTYIAHLAAKPSWVPPPDVGPITVNGTVDPSCSAHVLGGTTFIGDLAVSSSWNLDESFLTFFDVTDAANPCVIGGKTLTANPERPNSFTDHGTFKIEGFARGVATIHHSQGFAAYVAHGQAGIAAADIGHDIPEPLPAARTLEGFYSGDTNDVATFRDRVLALNNNYGGNASLDILTPDLGLVTSVDLGPFLPAGLQASKVHRLITARSVAVDRNHDGAIGSDEVFDFAFIGGAQGIVIVDISDLDNPQVAGRIAMPGFIRELDVDQSGLLLLAGGDRTNLANGDEAIFLINLANPFAAAVIDPATQLDTRVAFVIPYPGGVAGSKIDTARGLLYVGWSGNGLDSGGVDVWAFNRRGTGGNNPPIADAGPDDSVGADAPATLDGRGSHDPDGDDLTYVWTQTSGPTVTLLNPTTARPSFDPHGLDDVVLVFKLVVNDGTVDSSPDTVAITVRKEKVTLEPGIVALPTVSDTKQLTVMFKDRLGATTDVTAGSNTTYQWIGHPLVSGTGIPDVTAVLNALSQKLGVPVPLADIAVSSSGVLSANTLGVQLVRAHYEDGVTKIDSEPSLVLAGIKLDEIALTSESALTTLAGALASAFGVDKNPPMVLTTDDNGYVTDKGFVVLDDVVFKLLGSDSAKIGLKDLLDIVEPLIVPELAALPKPIRTVAGGIVTKAFRDLIGFAGTQALDSLESSDETIATVTNEDVKGLVQSHTSGLAGITGTLDLGPLGKADDSIFVWVLAHIIDAAIEHDSDDGFDTGDIAIQASAPPLPGRVVRTFVVASVGNGVIPVKGRADSVDAFLDRVLPGALELWTSIKKDAREVSTDTPVSHLKFNVGGNVDPTCSGPDSSGEVDCTLTFSDVTLGFFAPTGPAPLVTSTYTTQNPSIVQIGAAETFDTHLVHQGTIGVGTIVGHVSVALLGSPPADPSARVVVSDGPELDKAVFDGIDTVQPGATVVFKITVTNPYDTPLNNVQVTDSLFFTPAGASTEALLSAQTVPGVPATLAPFAEQKIVTSVTAPHSAGVLRNALTAFGSVPTDVSVTVQGPQLTKSVAGGATTVPVGTPIDFLVTVTNPLDVPMTNVQVVDTTYFLAAGAVGETVLQAQTLPIGTLPAHGVVTKTVSVVAPASIGNIRNEVTSEGSDPASAKVVITASALPTPMINEVVVTPFLDWDDSGGGGNGVPFDAVPGTSTPPSAAVNSGDQWIEFKTTTGLPSELLGWTLTFTDTTGALRTVTIAPGMLTGTSGTTHVVLGAPGAKVAGLSVPVTVSPTSVLALTSPTGVLVDAVNLAAITPAVGPATGAATEAIARTPDGTQSFDPAVFKRKPASIGAPNP